MSEKRPVRASAGVVGLTVNPDSGRACLVLGREAHQPGWTGSLCWSDFGGRAHSNDTHSTVTASRELYEEGLCVPLLGDGGVAGVAQRLAARDYVMRLTVRRMGPRYDVLRILYLVWVPWAVVVSSRATFHQRRRALLWVHNAGKRLDELCSSLRARNLPCPGSTTHITGSLRTVTDVCYVQQQPDGTFIAGLTCHTTPEEVGPTAPHEGTIIEVPVPDETAAVDYGTIALMRGRIRAVLSTLPPDLLSAAVVSHDHAALWSVPQIRTDFLEKDDIHALPLDVLALCTNRPLTATALPLTVERPRVRSGFIIPLKLLLQQLALGANHSWRRR
jgi:hypothetical protein